MNINQAKDILIDAKKDHEWAVSELATFEKKIRKHAYPLLIKQSNAQKFNLEFEQAIAQDEENWKRWQQLKNDVVNTSLDLFEAQLIWDITFEAYKNEYME
jgi:hypothetical protein